MATSGCDRPASSSKSSAPLVAPFPPGEPVFGPSPARVAGRLMGLVWSMSGSVALVLDEGATVNGSARVAPGSNRIGSGWIDDREISGWEISGWEVSGWESSTCVCNDVVPRSTLGSGLDIASRVSNGVKLMSPSVLKLDAVESSPLRASPGVSSADATPAVTPAAVAMEATISAVRPPTRAAHAVSDCAGV
ncbi:MAG: hypothetical protein LH603_00845 [Pseudonocardia sp.]|nr:hypothetical protein [Pseudonocardia sp.]